MRHTRLVVHQMHVDDDEVAVSLATLVAVRRDGTPGLDWEVVAKAVDPTSFQLGSNDLRLVVVSGADASGVAELSELSGRALVVRYVEDTVVWRGDGPLDGFEDAWLM